MNQYQVNALMIMGIFYVAYLMKLLLQRGKGIRTNQLGKGNKDSQTIRVEKILRIASFMIVPIELLSIILNTHFVFLDQLANVGVALGSMGVIIFIVAMWTMRDNWRAGVPEKDHTELVMKGIYKISRNPAFLGFDLTYIGILFLFTNPLLILATVFVIVMMHLQILEEEKFLMATFGKQYEIYYKKTGRYFVCI